MFCRMLARVTRMPYSDDSNRCRQGRPTGTLTVPRSPFPAQSPFSRRRGMGHQTPQVLGQGVRPSVPASSPGCSWPGPSLSSGFVLFPRPGLSVCPLSLALSALFSLWLGADRERSSLGLAKQPLSLSLALRPPLSSSPLPLSFLSSLFFVS